MHCWRKQSVTYTDEKNQVILLMMKVAVWREIVFGEIFFKPRETIICHLR